MQPSSHHAKRKHSGNHKQGKRSLRLPQQIELAIQHGNDVDAEQCFLPLLLLMGLWSGSRSLRKGLGSFGGFGRNWGGLGGGAGGFGIPGMMGNGPDMYGLPGQMYGYGNMGMGGMYPGMGNLWSGGRRGWPMMF